jgi:hypothetical protein
MTIWPLLVLLGGFATCTIGMSSTVAKTLVDRPNKADVVDNVDTGKFMLFLLIIGVPSVLVLVPIKKVVLPLVMSYIL